MGLIQPVHYLELSILANYFIKKKILSNKAKLLTGPLIYISVHPLTFLPQKLSHTTIKQKKSRRNFTWRFSFITILIHQIIWHFTKSIHLSSAIPSLEWLQG
ncbi:hypothetical protein [Cryptosporidium parvum Iowa II]|uniref:Uncharacterized protein n=2 Tax=Cryptosporidium parvum TaxID=5807 RepID=Q5CWR0_CRYPI|nr:hypothetical protein [Cryptosporidium parvum Iowa II]QOY41297.1 Uncharacterized protein CPATCC_0015710 [Cryptosporidium parvum]WKS78525.1 hypothetical protein CPCDC_6g4100 [Cryptosporidium sp. 43IA8]EAK90013.1 hypothetical protein cgd6_4100 [Cryptosporidium parvum Iowa II]WRK33017.1 Uncharacterized protein cpbgf_6004100 [Cryptosporidium parvum]CAD98451.1 hypothetical predicted transmembrane protein, unknown function [Cryptosporidium parvum]|eukprot:QOY41297.1 hypothetical protein CPATCC_002981 [Cryptosporidium parvum]